MKSARSRGGFSSSAGVPSGSAAWSLTGPAGVAGARGGRVRSRDEVKVARAVSVLRVAAAISSSFLATVGSAEALCCWVWVT